MKKLLLLLFIGIFLLSFISADVSIGSVKQGDTIQLTQICSNCSYVNLTSVLYPNNTYALLGQYAMTKNGTNYNYTWTDTNLLGNYVYTTCGDLNGVNTCQSVAFTVTPSGFQLSTDKSLIYGILLILTVCFDIFILWLIWRINPNNYKNDKEEYIGISLAKYFRIVLIGVTYALVIITLNLMNAVAVQLADITQFAGLIGGIFTILTTAIIPWSVFIFIWLIRTVWKDANLIKEIQKRLEESYDE